MPRTFLSRPSTEPSRGVGGHGTAQLLTFFGVAFVLVVVVTPLNAEQQAILGGFLVVGAIATSYIRTLLGRVTIASLAAIASTRYIYWRATETLEFSTILGTVFGYALFFAELYLWTVLVFSFLSTLPRRSRQPVPLPADVSAWPSVDVFIPTYNEELSLVRTTVLAAQAIDYPKEKLNIYILDDGRRPEFQDFAEHAGVKYITRSSSKFAKAGNINNALLNTDGELVAIFDCDHVPATSFLQMTVGCFCANPNLALVQTPHHFYNNDAFEKNLRSGDQAPNEGLLFYGLIQDGNDFWNACFFCGSCAVLRREALEEIGGIAVETVTEDAHTSLKMQRKGWDTAYIRQPLAAGLATESLGVHIGQRLRWARGMLQIFRLDNPLLGPGLTIAQRICYMNAMIHFMFPLPRVILLMAPLAYLLLGQRVIESDAWAVLAYGLPHLVVATISSTVLQGKYRHPLWGEFHETALSLHLVRPTLMTLFQPRKGKFNVTQKSFDGGEIRFDWMILRWHLILFAVLVCSVLYAFFAMATFNLPTDKFATTGLNAFWALVSALFVLVTIAVGVERPGQGQKALLSTDFDATLFLTDRRAIPVTVNRASVHELTCDTPNGFRGEVEGVELHGGPGRTAYFPATETERTSSNLRLTIQPNSLKEERKVAEIILGRESAWSNWDVWERGSFFASVGSALSIIKGLSLWALGTLRRSGRARIRGAAAAAGAAGLLAFLFSQGALAQSTSFDMGTSSFVNSTPNTDSLENRTITLSLQDFGVLQPLRMQGSSTARGVGFTLRSDEVVISARFALRVAYSPNLDPANSQLTVMLNGEAVHAQALDPLDGTLAIIEFDVNPYLFLPDNNLVFELRARRLGDEGSCEGESMVWAQVSNQSEIYLTVGRMSSPPDLANLPRPFFDPRDADELRLPFVFSERPSAATLKAASVTASYWGVETFYRGAEFPVFFNAIPPGNAVVFLTPGEQVQGIRPDIRGPSINVIQNPADPQSRLLLIMGRNADELNEAARGLSLGSHVFNSESALINAPLNEGRRAYDAPRWVPTDRPVTLGELATPQQLEGRGIAPGTLSVNFQTAPDFFVWGDTAGELTARYRAPGEQWIDVQKSRVDVLLNDKFLRNLSLVSERRFGFGAPRGDFPSSGVEVKLPAYLLYGQSQLQFYFDLQMRDQDPCAVPPGELRSAVDLDSTLDLSNLLRFTQMPNLAFLTQAGFPFTKFADLSETAVVLSPDFRAEDVEALLQMMGLMGARTGYPATHVEILFPGDLSAATDRDLLLLGTYNDQPLFREWADASPLKFNGQLASLKLQRAPEFGIGRFIEGMRTRGSGASGSVNLPMRSLSSILTSYESPLTQGRTVVAMMGSDSDSLVELAKFIRSPETASVVQGDLVTIAGGEASSFIVADEYYVGSLPPYTYIRWWVSENFARLNMFLWAGFALLVLGIYASMQWRSHRMAAREQQILEESGG